MSGPVLVPLDGSDLAEQALPLGLSIAGRTSRELLVLKVVPVPTQTALAETGGVFPVEKMLETMRERAREYLADVEERLRAYNVPVQGVVITARTAAEGIAEVADEHQAGFVVMATHGYTGLSRWALGSVTDRAGSSSPHWRSSSSYAPRSGALLSGGPLSLASKRCLPSSGSLCPLMAPAWPNTFCRR
ncbi:MAG: universal stress protein [Ardenticatenia bacterium]|nr:universal stress protein [Ardenticatenia bacterium]